MIWDSPEWRAERNERLLYWMKGDEDARRCVLMLSAISETWDDLIDGDRKPPAHEINQAFTNALIGLQLNPFFKKYEPTILAVVFVGINAWMDANDLEKTDDQGQRALSFYIRNFCYEVVSVCAMCAGGYDWLRLNSLVMRLFFQHESYFTWEKRL